MLQSTLMQARHGCAGPTFSANVDSMSIGTNPPLLYMGTRRQRPPDVYKAAPRAIVATEHISERLLNQ